MRIYIIGHDGITLCREAPATVNDGEVAVASKEELHVAPLSGKRLLALWNALPGVEKRRTVGDRKALIDRLWPAIWRSTALMSGRRSRSGRLPFRWRTGDCGSPACWRAEASLIAGFIRLPVRRRGRRGRVPL